MKKILIGIPVLDNLEMTRACLQHLIRNTQTDRLSLIVTILILDNGSVADIAGMLRQDFQENHPPLYYRKNPQNLGVATAWNQILRFSPDSVPKPTLYYDFYVIANNDVMTGVDWLQPMVEAMESNDRIGWISSLENASPVLQELMEAHAISKEYRVNPRKPFTADQIHQSVIDIYTKWGGHEEFCHLVCDKDLPLFIPFHKEGRSAACFMVRPAMIEQIGFFDEDFWPTGIAEDLEYFLRMERILLPSWLTEEVYPKHQKWLAGFCGKSVVHHNWCSTRQGQDFDGRRWDKLREKYWKKKFRKSKAYFTRLLP